MSNTITPTVFYRTLNVEGAGLAQIEDLRFTCSPRTRTAPLCTIHLSRHGGSHSE